VKRVFKKMTEPHPLEELVRSAFVEARQHDPFSMALFLAGAYTGVKGHAAYRIVAQDVLEVMARQGKLIRASDGSSWFSLPQESAYNEAASCTPATVSATT
jgi:hypothetical protein